MISKLDEKWNNESIPKEVKNNIKDIKSESNFLHDTDFIQLADYLFKAIQIKILNFYIKKLRKENTLMI